LLEAVRILSRTINTEDGVIGACLAEVATRLAELVEERRWISVGERLPTAQGEDVLTAIQFDDGSHDINLSWWNGECWMFYGAHVPGGPVTHWQPLPPGPEGET
jgi:hypothetical protein